MTWGINKVCRKISENTVNKNYFVIFDSKEELDSCFEEMDSEYKTYSTKVAMFNDNRFYFYTKEDCPNVFLGAVLSGVILHEFDPELTKIAIGRLRGEISKTPVIFWSKFHEKEPLCPFFLSIGVLE